MSVAVSAITTAGMYYANECVLISIEGSPSDSTTLRTAVYYFELIRADGSTFTSEPQSIPGGFAITVDLAKWAAKYLQHKVPDIDPTMQHNDYAYGGVNIYTAENTFNLETCESEEGTPVAAFGATDYEVFNCYLQLYEERKIITGIACVDTKKEVNMCFTGVDYLNVIGATTIDVDYYGADGLISSTTLAFTHKFNTYMVDYGNINPPAGTIAIVYNMPNGHTIRYNFCNCICIDCEDLQILYLEPGGAWSVQNFERIDTDKAGSSSTLALIDAGCRNTQYGGYTQLFTERNRRVTYQTRLPIRCTNREQFMSFATAGKVMVLKDISGLTWVKILNTNTEKSYYEYESLVRLVFTSEQKIEGHRYEV